MSADEFERQYAERSGITVEYLHDELGRRAIPCSCDYEHCQGWRIVSDDAADELEALELLPFRGK